MHWWVPNDSKCIDRTDTLSVAMAANSISHMETGMEVGNSMGVLHPEVYSFQYCLKQVTWRGPEEWVSIQSVKLLGV